MTKKTAKNFLKILNLFAKVLLCNYSTYICINYTNFVDY